MIPVDYREKDHRPNACLCKNSGKIICFAFFTRLTCSLKFKIFVSYLHISIFYWTDRITSMGHFIMVINHHQHTAGGMIFGVILLVFFNLSTATENKMRNIIDTTHMPFISRYSNSKQATTTTSTHETIIQDSDIN